MIFCAWYDRINDKVLNAGKIWCGSPAREGHETYALFKDTNGNLLPKRWYLYTIHHDARRILYEDIPEVVRLAYILSQ